jgi:HlyD family secretion protein
MSEPHHKPIVNFKLPKAVSKGQVLPAERPPNQRSLFLFVGLSLAVIVIVPFFLLRPRQEVYLLRSFSTAIVSKSSIYELVSASGKLVPEASVSIVAPAAGKVLELLIKAGDDVRKGQVLARLESDDLQKTFDSAQDKVQQAMDALNLEQLKILQEQSNRRDDLEKLNQARQKASQELENTKALFEIGAIAKFELIKAQDAVSDASLAISRAERTISQFLAQEAIKTRGLSRDLSIARTTLKKAKLDMQGSQIKAPFSGQILEVLVKSGQFVQVSNELFTLADTSRLRVDGEVDESVAGNVKPGQEVRILLNDQEYQGQVKKIAPQANQQNNLSTVPVTVVFTTVSPKVRPNTSLSFEIITGVRADVATLPRGPFLTTGGERLVFVLTAPDTAERREVRFGASSADKVEILDGLELNQKIISTSYEAFKDQLTIKVSPTGELK